MRRLVSSAMIAAGGLAASASSEPANELVVVPGVSVLARIDGKPARLIVGSGRLDRLTLDQAYVTAHGIKPSWLTGRGDLSVAGRKELKGHNRPVALAIAGRSTRTRAVWFAAVPDRIDADGSIGPWGVPQPRVTFTLAAPARDEQALSLRLQGSPDETSYAVVRLDGEAMALAFDIEDGEQLPIATAAAGALIAKAYGGRIEGPSWNVEILFGIKRPVRLVRLSRPMAIGPLSYNRIAVRTRDRIDDSGRGATIVEAGETADPDEIVVADRKGRTPNFVLSLPRQALKGCSRLTYDKTARKIELSCRPAAAS